MRQIPEFQPACAVTPRDASRPTASPQHPKNRAATSLVLAALAHLLLAMPALAEQPVVAHRIDAVIDPASGVLRATDHLTLPTATRQVVFLLHEGLDPRVQEDDAVLERIGREGHLASFRLTVNEGNTATLSYGGRIRHPLQTVREGMGRASQRLIGTIGDDGVFLSGYTGWYPDTPGALNRMDLSVRVPPGWLVVSQGAGPEPVEGDDTHIRWVEENPQDELYLNAARFTLYRRATPHGEAQVYLRQPDGSMAERYLDATSDYLTRYSELIGDYPYEKFALVENFWETGYGMPSFTLLGSRVLRLPFILHSSYPHEILHNWWGNGVYVDYAAGNWSEGLTTYLSDHLNQALRGQGPNYRRDKLQAYTDYVRDGDDVPLTNFRGRHGVSSQAVGYGKMLMLAHMLRVKLGDETFRSGLRTFYRENRFRTASFEDLQAALERASNEDLGPFFDAWTNRTGAAALGLADVEVEQAPGGGYVVSGSVHQIQQERPFPMTVPVVVHDERGKPLRVLAPFDGRIARFSAELAAPPARVSVDPQFDTFRRLLPEESPTSLSRLFGADRGLMVLPEAASATTQDAYRRLAESWRRGNDGWEIVLDGELDALPGSGAVWLLGWENAFVETFDATAGDLALDVEARILTLAGEPQRNVSIALATGDAERPLGWVAAASPAAIPGLARKLPHYNKYGYLAFTGDAPDNTLKGQWPAGDSALNEWLSEARPPLQMPKQSTLTPR